MLAENAIRGCLIFPTSDHKPIVVLHSVEDGNSDEPASHWPARLGPDLLAEITARLPCVTDVHCMTRRESTKSS